MLYMLWACLVTVLIDWVLHKQNFFFFFLGARSIYSRAGNQMHLALNIVAGDYFSSLFSSVSISLYILQQGRR